MALFKVKPIAVEDDAISSKIKQRRLQILVHSCIYYDLGDSIVSDAKWQQWSNELLQLQKDYPQIADKVIYAQDFKTFDGTTGYNLPYRSGRIVAKAVQLLKYKERKDSNGN